MAPYIGLMQAMTPGEKRIVVSIYYSDNSYNLIGL